MPRHMEQHGSRHSNPASSSTRSSPSCLRLLLHQARAGHHQRAHAGGHLAARGHRGGGADVLDPAVGATADEHHVDRHVLPASARASAPCSRACAASAPAPPRPRRSAGSGTDAGHRHHRARVGAPGDHRRDVGGIQHHRPVVDRARIGRQGAPVGHRLLERRALRRVVAALARRRRWSRPARSARRARRPRSTCWTPSSARPCPARGSPRRRTRSRGRCRRRCRSCR